MPESWRRTLTGWGRFAWASLTSMRTALILLLILGVAAIPGSFLPQRPSDPIGVADHLRANPTIGPWLNRLGFYDVFGSAWFAAIYLLLFISLIGCILPRTASFAKALREPPAPAPGKLTRLPTHTAGEVLASKDQVLTAASQHLGGRGFRVRTGSGYVSAERGYLREAGNLVFHISLVGVLIGLAWGALFSHTGTAIVVEGQSFSNTLSQYDEFHSGAGFDTDTLAPFTITLDRFEVRFENGPVQQGAARDFKAHVTLTEPTQAPWSATIEVNHPLQVANTTVHLLGHGYAPVITVRDGNGDVALSGPVVFLPQDGNFTSAGVIKAPDARPLRLASEGIFLPTAAGGDGAMLTSVFPDVLDPKLALNAYTGPPRPETGAPENVYVLDRTGLTQLTSADGQPLRAALTPGERFELPDDQGSISFDGWKRWTKLQFSAAPGGWLVLGAVLAAVAGMSVSLTVKPRRLFVRVSSVTTGSGAKDPGLENPSGDEAAHHTRVSVAGLDRVEGRSGLADEVASLAQALGIGDSGPDKGDS